MGIIEPIPPDNIKVGTPNVIVRLFFGSEIDPAPVFLSTDKIRSVDWNDLLEQMVVL